LPDEPIKARLRWTSRVGGLSTVLNTDSLPLCVSSAVILWFKSLIIQKFGLIWLKSFIVKWSYLAMWQDWIKKLIGYDKHKVWKYFLPMRQLKTIKKSQK